MGGRRMPEGASRVERDGVGLESAADDAPVPVSRRCARAVSAAGLPPVLGDGARRRAGRAIPGRGDRLGPVRAHRIGARARLAGPRAVPAGGPALSAGRSPRRSVRPAPRDRRGLRGVGGRGDAAPRRCGAGRAGGLVLPRRGWHRHRSDGEPPLARCTAPAASRARSPRARGVVEREPAPVCLDRRADGGGCADRGYRERQERVRREPRADRGSRDRHSFAAEASSRQAARARRASSWPV